jgi:signal transduction histidine kinase
MCAKLRELSARLLEVREQERAAISRRVHDELGQALTTLQWDVEKLSAELARPHAVGQPAVHAKLKAMSDTIAGALLTVRTVASDLRPPMLDQFGLLAAIRWQAGEFHTRYGIACDVFCEQEEITPSRCTATAAFRIFQEILTNVARHAEATEVRVRLAEAASSLSLTVHDNGKGIPDGRESGSLGILGMRERAWLLGGTVEITSGPRAGTTIAVRLPMQISYPEGEGAVSRPE